MLLLIDGHGLAFRSYYAFAKGRDGGLKTSTGIPTNVCFGFLKALFATMAAHHPDHLAIAFDRKEPTFRHQLDPEYKATRKPAPADFLPDLQNLQELLGVMGIPVITQAGYEADDILGTLARQYAQEGVKVLTGDRDLFQLVDDAAPISILYFDRLNRSNLAGATEYNAAAVVAKMGVRPDQIVDFKALCGDASDNIPGVQGIGEKTAQKLLADYETLTGVYDHLPRIKGTLRDKLERDRPQALRSQQLARIEQNVPLEHEDLAALAVKPLDGEAIAPHLERLELKQLLSQLGDLAQPFGNPEPEEGDTWFFTATETAAAQTPEPAPITPQIITTATQLTQLIATLQTCTTTPIAWDTETTGLDTHTAQLVGIGCCWGSNADQVAYIPIAHQQGEQLPWEMVRSHLAPLLTSSDHPKVFQNAKYDRLILQHHGLDLAGVVFDTMLASYVIRPEASHNLTDLCDRYLTEITAYHYSDLKIPKGETIADQPIERIALYCGLDVYATYHLVEPLKAELAKTPNLETIFNTVEIPLEPVLAAMEYAGIRINQPYLQTLSEHLATELARIEQAAYDHAGQTFNLSSPKQLSELFFNTLGLNPKKSRKIKTGYSTDHATLEKLQGDHPVVDCILEHRTLAKLKSTYVDALPALVNPKSDRLHTDFNQAVTTTGRLSSSNPNLQNIPIRSEFSRQIRQAFLPREGWILVTADYSQIELRILAHLSQEPILLDAYQQGDDVHAVTARLLFDQDEVTPEQRRLGKTINFGVIYGMGAQRFAREAGVSPAEGKQFIERYRSRYPQVFDYLETQKRRAIALGYVETLFGRRRYFNFSDRPLLNLRGHAPDTIDLDSLKRLSLGDSQLLRAAANAPIQGSSADIIKVAMVKINQILEDYQAQLLLQVHDELVLEMPPTEWEELKPKICDVMETAVNLTVPLKVDIHAGKNWMAAK
ncbi:MAG: DNA polymerase I [Spirulina sp. DLM2.Bin59]|nr:MAG: DNA polymerase I [Spirulina sp. DLM2.Bin59]